MTIKPQKYMKPIMFLVIAFIGQIFGTTSAGNPNQKDGGWEYHCGCDSAPDGSWNYEWGTGKGPDGSSFSYGSGSGRSPDGGRFGYGFGSSSSSDGGSSGSYGVGVGLGFGGSGGVPTGDSTFPPDVKSPPQDMVVDPKIGEDQNSN